MAGHQDTGLWARTLAPRHDDPNAGPRERLRQAYEKMRERAATLVGEISRVMPDYTVHDITHLDALWEMADLIAGPTYALNPAEAFVLGGAILIHDAGMSLAAYPRGLDDLKGHKMWSDTVAYYSTIDASEAVEGPAPTDISPAILSSVVPDMLRRLHAEQAEHLTTVEWSDTAGRKYRLLEDEDLRQLFGSPIGQIAHSHWWSIEEVEQRLANRTLGAPTFCPADWIIDLLKVACLLRVSDAAHLDARRAPGFLRALRHPAHRSKLHWVFQERLTKPTCRGDALYYTSAEPFQSSEAEAWWLCFEALNMVDAELRHTDALLGDKRSELLRFAGRRVANVEDPDRLVQNIPVAGWRPVDTKIHIADVTGLISKLGGEELYGRNPSVALRELIQNATDAIRARRKLENRSDEWGTVKIRLFNIDDSHWLEVEDDGIGMSEQVIRHHLLNFGSSYWGSELMRTEFPGLLAQGLRTTGRYGIGFFSLSILSDDVRILTRRFNAGYDETYSLDFASGLWARPILRAAPSQGGELRDGGTRVRVRLKVSPEAEMGLLNRHYQPLTLAALCGDIAPAVDVNLSVAESDGTQRLYTANEWLTLSGAELCRKLNAVDLDPDYKAQVTADSERFGNNIRSITDRGRILGRMFIIPEEEHPYRISGCVAVGGLAATGLRGVCGIIEGSSIRAARDIAIPLADIKMTSKWASEQADLLSAQALSPKEQAEAASTVYKCGGDTKALKIALTSVGWLNAHELAEWASAKARILLEDQYRWMLVEETRPDLLLNDNLVFVETSRGSILNPAAGAFYFRPLHEWPRTNEYLHPFSDSLAALVMELLAACWKQDLETLYSQVFDGRKFLRLPAEIGRDGAFSLVEEVYHLMRLSA